MKAMENQLDIEFISLYGHLSYTITCPHCLERFEKHAMNFPDEVICPYCKTVYRSEMDSLRRTGDSSVLTFDRPA